MYQYKLTSNNVSNGKSIFNDMVSVLSKIFATEYTKILDMVRDIQNGRECKVDALCRISSTDMREMFRVGIDFEETSPSEAIEQNANSNRVLHGLKNLVTVATNDGQYDLAAKLLILLKDFEQ